MLQIRRIRTDFLKLMVGILVPLPHTKQTPTTHNTMTVLNVLNDISVQNVIEILVSVRALLVHLNYYFAVVTTIYECFTYDLSKIKLKFLTQ